ncbi:MAG: hypothetical protein HKN82_17755 [Akkermansiaceae bacterium]|nr:hypothetical protein [Akkermansiaceae bacterium]NNM31071.1 hypothetical protein [Akkermansiaceae bacterium]
MRRSPCAWLVLVLAPVPAAALDYERDVMPIFAKKCYDCHSAEAGKWKGGLRLDDAAHFRKRFAKHEVVIPGDWDASYLFVVITRPPDHKETMPPKDKGERLTPDEIMTVAKWIHEGARINGDRGDRGDPDFAPEDFVKFDRHGRLVTEQFGADAAAAPEPATARPRSWTNQEGKTITATFKGMEGSDALLLLANGRTVRYPLAKLSAASRAEIEKLAAGGAR